MKTTILFLLLMSCFALSENSNAIKYELVRKNYNKNFKDINYQNCIDIFSESKNCTDTDIRESFIPGIGLVSVSNALAGKWNLFDYSLVTSCDENRTYKIIDISLSPNPASDFIEITNINPTVNHGVEYKSIKIHDIFCQNVLSVEAIHELPLRIDVSGLAPGMYFVRIGDKVGKFIKL